MWDDLKGMLEELKNRISSPFMSSFLISWILWNHKLVMVLLSGYDVEKKWYYMEHVLYPSSHFVDYPFQARFLDWLNTINFWHLFNTLWFLVIAPLISVLFYHFFYPCIERWFYKKHLQNLKNRNEITEAINMASKIEELTKILDGTTKNNADNEKKIQDLIEKIVDVENKNKELTEVCQQREQENAKFEKKLEALTTDNNQLSEENETLKKKAQDEDVNELSDDELDVLNIVSQQDNISSTRLFTGPRAAHRRYAATSLVEREFISYDSNINRYNITNKGNLYLVKNT